ncbi:membrane dipeptidase [Streptomyces sp. PT12]|uniref:membrane dipeptidase n=1 Tax=Streptomyces sp. PT12 TaxID=1510197 RepID=UPI00215CCCC1|nr:membrane dipeptidase [Streptomyces sp. PT12]
MLPSYNTRSAAGGGCLDDVDEGLTACGRALIREMNAVGMVADGSHCGARTGLDMCEVSQQPAIYSHSCMRAVWDHPRDITDEQAKACAATGGGVGITGVGIFLGPNVVDIDALVRHIDRAVDLVGPDRVGLLTDRLPVRPGDFKALLEESPELFPECYTRRGADRVPAAGGPADRRTRAVRPGIPRRRRRRHPGRHLPPRRRAGVALARTTPTTSRPRRRKDESRYARFRHPAEP